VHRLLEVGAATVSTAESLTGGRLASLLTTTPGSSRTFVGGVVVYATALKVELLAVPPDLVDRYGVVSAECAAAMASGVRLRTGSTYGVSTTGVAGPDSQEEQPVGRVFVGVAGPAGTTTTELRLAGERREIQQQAADEALVSLVAYLRREESGVG
jgi:nicotinamide-nucleotide amidase